MESFIAGIQAILIAVLAMLFGWGTGHPAETTPSSMTATPAAMQTVTPIASPEDLSTGEIMMPEVELEIVYVTAEPETGNGETEISGTNAAEDDTPGSELFLNSDQEIVLPEI